MYLDQQVQQPGERWSEKYNPQELYTKNHTTILITLVVIVHSALVLQVIRECEN